MSAINVLSTYSLAAISNGVNASSGSPAYIWSVAIPSGAKGKSGVLEVFFNLYCASSFFAGQYFDYGIYIDGTSIALGDSTTTRYTQTAATTYAMSSGGILRGTNGILGYNPLSIPLSIPSGATSLQIGITNSSLPMATATSVTPHVTSNVTTSSGTLNTNNYIPQNTFTTTGATATYTVPTTVQGGAVQGVFIYCWGCGGSSLSANAVAGGGGGYATGFYSCSGGTVLSYIVGSAGGYTIPTGGGGNTNGPPSGGGFSGVFASSTISQGNAIVIAGGGAGASSSTVANGGGGGGTTGSYGLTTTGTQITNGYWGFSNFTLTQASQAAGNAVFLGQSAINNVWGAGGGGYWGGYFTNGGSGYIGGATSAGTMSNGTTFTAATSTPSDILPGNPTSPYYVAGRGTGNGAAGLVVIVPAIGSTATQIGVSATLYSL